MRHPLLACALAALCAHAPGASNADRRVAVTLDDLPFVGAAPCGARWSGSSRIGPIRRRSFEASRSPPRGCLVIGMPRVGYTGDADLARWPATIRSLAPLGAQVVVPGHGDRFGADLLDHTLALLTALNAAPPR